MTKTILFFFFLSYAGWTYCQNMEPSVVATGGGIDSTAQLTLEWTLGELAVATIASEDIQFTEGYHQPWLIVSDYDEHHLTHVTGTKSDHQITVSPNPVKSIVNVQIQFSESSEVYISLFSLEGKQLIEQFKKQSADSFEMDLSDLSPGLYLLRFTDSNGQFVRTFKLSKIN